MADITLLTSPHERFNSAYPCASALEHIPGKRGKANELEQKSLSLQEERGRERVQQKQSGRGGGEEEGHSPFFDFVTAHSRTWFPRKRLTREQKITLQELIQRDHIFTM